MIPTTHRAHSVWIAAFVLLVQSPADAQEPAGAPGAFLLRASEPPADGWIQVPASTPPIVRAYLASDRARAQLPLDFNADASRIRLKLPTRATADGPATIFVETAEKSGQLEDGRIVFSALDAEIHGKSAKLESHPGNHRIGFWTDPGDWVSWSHEATRPGTYEIELTYSLDGGGGTDARVEVGAKSLEGKLEPTGSWYVYTAKSLGKLSIVGPGAIQVAVRCAKKSGVAAMNLKAVTLRPAGEGKPIVQSDDGSIICHARDVTIHGVKVQYEPKPEKNTVGYWIHEKDQVSWSFTLTKPGRFDVEVLQGCGKGQGGSEVRVDVAGQKLGFVVEDTGHFQNFVPRVAGAVEIRKAGRYTLSVKPRVKPGLAVMDLRAVTLKPVQP